MNRSAAALLRRELALAWAGGGGPLLSIGLFAAITLMLPFGVGPDPAALGAVATGVAWISLVIASLLSLDRMFEQDLRCGALDLLALGPAPLELVGAIKALSQWLATGLPLALAAPLGALALGADLTRALMIVGSAAIGGLAIAFLGGAGAALALASRRGGVLIALVVLPLLIPPVIFGAAPGRGGLALLAAYAVAAVGLCPFAMAAGCRNALS